MIFQLDNYTSYKKENVNRQDSVGCEAMYRYSPFRTVAWVYNNELAPNDRILQSGKYSTN